MNDPKPLSSLPLLQVQGGQIVDDCGKPVRLRGMSEVELDQVLQSFALSICQANQELLDIALGYFARPAEALDAERGESVWQA